MLTSGVRRSSAMRTTSCATVASAIALLVATTTCVTADLRLDGGPTGWDQSRWYVQVDGVMGGRSTGDLTFTDSGTVLDFSGDISLIGGGFSSVRRRFSSALDLSDHAGVVVEVETHDWTERDAPLGMHLQFGDSASYYGFSAAFAVPLADVAGESASIYLPLDDFDRGTRIGWQCSNCALDTSSINEMDLYVLYQDGSFDARIRSITAVMDAPSRSSAALRQPKVTLQSRQQGVDLIQSAIDSGGYMYDQGYRELCISVYRSALNTLMTAAVNSGADDDAVESINSVRNVACAGLRRSLQEADKNTIAWLLRDTMDAIIADLSQVERSGRAPSWLPSAGTFAETQERSACSDDPNFAWRGRKCSTIARMSGRRKRRFCQRKRSRRVRRQCPVACNSCQSSAAGAANANGAADFQCFS